MFRPSTPSRGAPPWPLHWTTTSSHLLDAWWRAANYLTVGQIYLQANPLLREPLRPEHIKPRLLGHWGTSPGLSFLYAHLNRLIRRTSRRRDLHRRARSRRAGGAWPTSTSRAPTPRSTPRSRPTRPGMRAPRSASSPRPAASRATSSVTTPGLDPRGRRARLRARARVRRRVRQPRPARRLRRRRRRGRDRPARGLVEGHPLPQPGARRRRAADPAPQRLQDRGPDGARPGGRRRGRALLLDGHGYDVARRRRRRARARCTATFADGARRAASRGSATIQARRARGRRARARAPALARDRAAHAEGLDRARTWSTACRSRARSARTRCRSADVRDEPRAPRAARGLAAQLPPRASCSTRTAGPCPTLAALAPERRPADGREPARQRRPAHPSASTCPTRRDYAARRSRRRRPSYARVDAPARRAAARHLPRQRGTADFRLFCPDETNSNRLGAVFEVDRPLPRRAPIDATTTTCRPTAG